jgi:Domain of unknown function (DUF4394)/Calx-beta domain
MRCAPPIAAAVVLAWMAPPAVAAPAVGVIGGPGATGAPVVVTLDTADPGTYTSVHSVTGMQPNERIAALDTRSFPVQAALDTGARPRLFAFGVLDTPGNDEGRLYTLDPGTGAATLVGGPGSIPGLVLTDGAAYGMAFQPQVDRFRFVNTADQNFRLNPNSGGVAGIDAPVDNPTVPNQDVPAVTYDRVDFDQATLTTLFDVDLVSNNLMRQGGLDGLGPGGANGGQLSPVGPLGFGFNSLESVNADVGLDGSGFATGNTGLTPGLFTLSLDTGKLTLVGTTPTILRAFALLDPAGVQFSAASFTQAEGGDATITVTRGPFAEGTQTVAFAATPGTAGGADFGQVSGTLTFAADETSKTFTVPIVNDSADEPDETIALTLGSPSPGLGLGDPSAATLVVADDDAPPPPPPVPDTTSPSVAFKGLPSKLSYESFVKGFKITLTPTEAASLDVALYGTVKKATAAAYNLSLWTKSLSLAAGARSVTCKPSSKLVGKPKKAFKVLVRLVLTDAARNRRTVDRTIKVSAPKPKRKKR